MGFDEILGLSFPTLFLVLMALEAAVGKGRRFAVVRYWRLIGFAGFALTMFVNVTAPLVLLPPLPGVSLFDLSALGFWGAIPTIILTTFFTYWSHRIQHRFDLFWRLGHQLHHAVPRVDVASAMIFHPIDVFAQVFWSLLAAVLLGVSPQTAGLAGLGGFLIAIYQHLDMPTPRWTGWFIQRPEAHMLHHQRDVHSHNYGDMPVWDRVFGTYGDPAGCDVEVGFLPERARRVAAMLACIDVNSAQGRERL